MVMSRLSAYLRICPYVILDVRPSRGRGALSAIAAFFLPFLVRVGRRGQRLVVGLDLVQHVLDLLIIWKLRRVDLIVKVPLCFIESSCSYIRCTDIEGFAKVSKYVYRYLALASKVSQHSYCTHTNSVCQFFIGLSSASFLCAEFLCYRFGELVSIFGHSLTIALDGEVISHIDK